jgi:hypothetical protein
LVRSPNAKTYVVARIVLAQPSGRTSERFRKNLKTARAMQPARLREEPVYRVRSNRCLDGFATVFLLAFASLGASHIARADAVLDWNAIAVDTVWKAVPPRPVPVSFLDMAIVQAAVYDAVEAIGGKFKPYQVQIPGASMSPR